MRIDDPDSERCVNQELALAFPDIVECEIQELESLYWCSLRVAQTTCGVERCMDELSCDSFPDFAEYRELRRRCGDVLYCDDGQEGMGRRCNGQAECSDESDEDNCD